MADPELLQKVRALRDFVQELRRYASVESADLERDLSFRLAGEMLLIHIVEYVWDINQIVAVMGGHMVPATYREAVERLPELGLGTAEEAGQMAVIVRVRNRIVHTYDEVRTQELAECLRLAARAVPLYMANVYRSAQAAPGDSDNQG